MSVSVILAEGIQSSSRISYGFSLNAARTRRTSCSRESSEASWFRIRSMSKSSVLGSVDVDATGAILRGIERRRSTSDPRVIVLRSLSDSWAPAATRPRPRPRRAPGCTRAGSDGAPSPPASPPSRSQSPSRVGPVRAARRSRRPAGARPSSGCTTLCSRSRCRTWPRSSSISREVSTSAPSAAHRAESHPNYRHFQHRLSDGWILGWKIVARLIAQAALTSRRTRPTTSGTSSATISPS